MSLRSFWTPEAEESFLAITEYWRKGWGVRVADVFVSDVLHTLALLEKFPGGGMMEVPDLGIQSIPVASQVRLFYAVKGSHLLVLEFIDTRTSRFQRIRG